MRWGYSSQSMSTSSRILVIIGISCSMRAMRSENVAVDRIEIDQNTGRIVIVPATADTPTKTNEWDNV